MQVVDTRCVILIVVSYLAYGIIGVAVEYAAVRQSHQSPDRANNRRKVQLERLDRVWKRSRIPVWLGLIVAAWFFCQ